MLRARVKCPAPVMRAGERRGVGEVRTEGHHRWVVDTGASRHVCHPGAVAGAVRPTEAIVETANGTVRAAGTTIVPVSQLDHAVEAVILPGAPCLLSAGSLVARGYALKWSPSECVLATPHGRAIPLRVADGIPMLPED